eukprot:370412_1
MVFLSKSKFSVVWNNIRTNRVSSLNLQTIKTQNNQTFHVLDHPNHIMSNLEDAGVQDILKQIYDSMQLNSNTGFILTNTDIAGRHWKWYFYQKVNLVWCGITSEPTGYNSRDTESIVTGKQLFECILNGAGIANNIFLKDCICLPFMTVRRVIELLTPFSEKLSDAIASEMTQCLNDKWRDAWVDQIIELNTSWMEISDSPLRIEASDLLKELLPALHLSNEEYIVIKDMSASNRGLNLGTVRSMAAFNNLSDTCRKLITNVVIARNIKSIRQINIEQTKSASEMIFTDNVFMEFMDIATNYIYSMNADKLSDVETCAPILANIHKVTVKISKKIRKRAYDDGWNLICSIQQENNNVAIH